MPGTGIEKVAPWAAVAEMAINPLLGHLTNVKNRKFTREMYNRQRQDALLDWSMTNEYNSPRMQMQRFQEAGLNPNLIYGQMTDSPMVRSASASGGEARAPEVNSRNLTGNLMAGYDMSMRSAQTDLVAKQMSLIEEDIKLRQVQQAATIAGTGKTSAEIQRIMFDLGLSKDLRETTIAGKESEVRKMNVETDRTVMEMAQMLRTNPLKVQEMVLDILQKKKNLAKTDAEISEINARIALAKQELTIRSIDEELARRGINPKDPGLLRWAQHKIRRLIEPLGESLPGIGHGLKNWRKK